MAVDVTVEKATDVATVTSITKTGDEILALFNRSRKGEGANYIQIDNSGKHPALFMVSLALFKKIEEGLVSTVTFGKSLEPMPVQTTASPEDQERQKANPMYSWNVTGFKATKLVAIEKAARGITALSNLKKTAEALEMDWEQAIEDFA